MADEYFFRGSIIQYWQAAFDEWQRLKGQHAGTSFDLFAQNLTTPPFREYSPLMGDMIEMNFGSETPRVEIVAVLANSVRGKQLVRMEVFIQIEADEEFGAPALATWLKVKSAFDKKNLLIDPLAQYQDKKERGMYGNKESNFNKLREIRRKYINKYKRAPTMSYAMSMADVSYYLCKTYVPDLLKNWKVIEYE